MNNKKTGIFIATLRKEKGLTQKDLANKLFVTDRAVSKWERGIGYPDITIITSLSQILGVSPNEILYGEKSNSIDKQEVIKDSVKFYNKLQKISIFKNIIIFTPIILIILLLMLMTFVEFNKGYIPFTNQSIEFDDWPSFSKYSNERIVKKTFKAIQNHDYQSLEELIFPSDIKQTRNFIEEFKYLESQNVKFLSIKKQSGNFGYYGYTGQYIIEVEYNNIKSKFSVGMIKNQNRVDISGGVIYLLPQDLMNNEIWKHILKPFTVDIEEFIDNIQIEKE